MQSGVHVGLHLFALLTLCAAGCTSHQRTPNDSLAHYQGVASEIEFPDVEVDPKPATFETQAPITIRNLDEIDFRAISLEQVIETSLAQSEVMRDLGGAIVSAPTGGKTIHDSAIQDTDPLTGTEAALSAFDANFATSLFHTRSEQVFNNAFAASGTAGLFQQTTSVFQSEINKQTATGSRFALRNRTNYARNNSAFNRFPSAYTTVIEAEIRQPLLQGAGIEFNRIAGPTASPGNYNGILIARINTDISLVDFEIAIRNLIGDIELAYWELYFGYRDFDAKRQQRDASLATWRLIQRQVDAGRIDSEREALARQQYYQDRELVENAFTVLLSSERRVRFLMGLPASDGKLLRPNEEPIKVDTRFDWDEALLQSLVRRAELRKQKWVIKRREMELIAARGMLKMRLDFVGQYRRNGFGDDLLGNNGTANNSASESLFTDGLDDWTLGLELSTPVGNRIGHTAVRNAVLQLTREKAIHREMELSITHELSAAFAELDRAYAVSRSRFNRSIAAHQQLELIRKKYDVGTVPLEFLLDAQRRVSENDSAYYRTQVDHNLAIINLHRVRGTLLVYHSIRLSEGPWTEDAHDHAQKEARRFQPNQLNYCLSKPEPLTRGAYEQAEAHAKSQNANSEILPVPAPN